MSRDLHRVALRDPHYSAVYTCDMFHLHDVSRRRHVGCCGITRTTAAYHKSFMTSKCHSRNSLLDVFVSTLPPLWSSYTIGLFKKCIIDLYGYVLLILFAPFRRGDQSIFLSPETIGNVTNGKRKSHISAIKVAILFSRFIGKRPNLICGNLKLPDVSRMNYWTLPQRTSNDSSWRVPAIDSPCVPSNKI